MRPQPNRFFHLSLIFLVALNLIPHLSHYATPTLIVGGLCLCWRLLYEYQIIPLPNLWIKLGLILCLFYLIYINYGSLIGLEPGSVILICAVSLKLIDRVSYRDAMILLFLNFILLLTCFFQSQTLGITVFAIFDLIMVTALLVQIHNGSHVEFNIGSLLKTGTRLFLQISPLMVLLFFVFPRFSINFIGLKAGQSLSRGFGETIEPGSVSRLIKSDQPAFHAKFHGTPPPLSEMYWRGAIFTVNEGMKWTRIPPLKTDLEAPKSFPEDSLKQEILMEPVFSEWLFSIDRFFWIQHKNKILQKLTQKTESLNFVLDRAYSKKFIYTAHSSPKFSDSLAMEEKNRYLQSPVFKDPRIDRLINKIKMNAKTNRQKALNLMLFYQKQFLYTLNPGTLKGNGLAEFVFEKKRGFCEHFATSFSALMRLAKVPSRVVVGFHGGMKSQFSEYYLITGRDAHAWTEIWSEEEKRWLRFDPTLMVSPLRFELGGQIYHSLTESDLLKNQNKDKELLKQFDIGWLKRTHLTLDALAIRWNLFLLKYDHSGQTDFLKKLGFGNINQGSLLIISLLLLLIFFLVIRLKNTNPKPKKEPEQKAYEFLLNWLAKQGIEKSPSEGPSDFLIRCQKELPNKKNKLEAFRQAYLYQHYGNMRSDYNFKKINKTFLKP